jgi:hypothetical protein
MYTRSEAENLKLRNHLQDLGVDKTIKIMMMMMMMMTIICILKKEDGNFKLD